MPFDHILSSILESLQKDHLHHGIWPDGRNLDDQVRQKLMRIAKDFVNDHEIPKNVITDITVTGSMANFNWTSYSDIDLHILLDYRKVEECEEILSDYYNMAKSQWNDKHKITIFDHEVEIYVQDSAEPHHSTGVYSLMNGRWLTKPDPLQKGKKPSDAAVQRKTEKLMHRINKIDIRDEHAQQLADELMQIIRDMRMEGLRGEGEYSIENLVFKQLRNNGYLDKLKSSGMKAYDKRMSIDDK